MKKLLKIEIRMDTLTGLWEMDFLNHGEAIDYDIVKKVLNDIFVQLDAEIVAAAGDATNQFFTEIH